MCPRVTGHTECGYLGLFWDKHCLCNVRVQCVCGPGWDKEPAQAEMRLTILLMGFRLG